MIELSDTMIERKLLKNAKAKILPLQPQRWWEEVIVTSENIQTYMGTLKIQDPAAYCPKHRLKFEWPTGLRRGSIFT